jgi:glycerophosphoryl diester phosphodiesterase
MDRTRATSLLANKAGALVLMGTLALTCSVQSTKQKLVVAHRGASAYAPEHTAAAYELAIFQGTDYVEQDLQVTKDGVLVCVHDPVLERTTNVKEVFPDRFREVDWQGGKRRVWLVKDFTLEEIKQLDAGSWFGPEHSGATILTLKEAIELIRGRSGLFPELKNPQLYRDLEPSFEELLLETLSEYGLDGEIQQQQPSVIVQSFDENILRRLKNNLGCQLPLVFLISREMDSSLLSKEGLRRIKEFASGIGPSKHLLHGDPEIVTRAHELGLTVTPYTFNNTHLLSGFDSAMAEMSYFLYAIGVDGLFTDNPDLFPHAPMVSNR